ncbi:MAG TPA: phytanoyl-CoA dioxygenase family protein [Pyrinomonadaceae bacterium]|nr:phytanoyl-CoA dioxygenase family protein [Pyrinomonadaceae bacterium]
MGAGTNQGGEVQSVVAGGGRYDAAQLDALADEARRESFCVLRGHFDADLVAAWREAFAPLLEAHIAREGHRLNRGAARYYVTLPFREPFADPRVYEDEDVLGVCARLVGADMQLHQLATDTPLKGSEYQDVHRDVLPLFPETGRETPLFQLAVNFPLVDVTEENGPFEVARATHMLTKAEALSRIESGAARLEALTMKAGDVMIRDVRALHRGTPNRTDTPRPMVVLGYSRRWLFRPEVSIRVPRAAWPSLSARARFLLRFNPLVDDIDDGGEEVYQSFAY